MRNLLFGGYAFTVMVVDVFVLSARSPSDAAAAGSTSVSALSEIDIPAESLIRLRDALDEPEYYCIDVAGFGSSLDRSAPLQAHTCKPGADDELFTLNHPLQGQIYMDAYRLCVESDGDMLYVRDCSDSPNQRFLYTDDGAISLLGDESLCVAAAEGAGEPAGGRSHLRRDLLIRDCDQAEPSLSRWVLPGNSP